MSAGEASLGSVSEVDELFALFDTDGSGSIDAAELQALTKKLGRELTPQQLATARARALSPAQLARLAHRCAQHKRKHKRQRTARGRMRLQAMEDMDEDRSGEVDKGEFKTWWLKQQQAGEGGLIDVGKVRGLAAERRARWQKFKATMEHSKTLQTSAAALAASAPVAPGESPWKLMQQNNAMPAALSPTSTAVEARCARADVHGCRPAGRHSTQPCAPPSRRPQAPGPVSESKAGTLYNLLVGGPELPSKKKCAVEAANADALLEEVLAALGLPRHDLHVLCSDEARHAPRCTTILNFQPMDTRAWPCPNLLSVPTCSRRSGSMLA